MKNYSLADGRSETGMSHKFTTSGSDVELYGLYQARLKVVPACGTNMKRENWMGALPTNHKSSGGQKFKKY